MTTTRRDHMPRGLIEALVVVAVSIAVTWLLFYPAFSDLSGQVIRGPKNQHTDTNLIMWILSWGFHALSTAPLELFQANILHPSPASLATTEHMLGYLPLYGPPYAATGNPVLALQLTVLLSFALSGAAMYALLRHWGCSVGAAAFGGFVLLAVPGKFRSAHLVQTTGWFYLPLALVFLDRIFDRGRLRDAAAFGCMFALQLMCSFYLAYISAVIVGAYALAVAPWRDLAPSRSRRWNVWLALLSGGVLAAVIVLPVSLPYAQRIGAGEIAEQTKVTSFLMLGLRSWRDYLVSPGLSELWTGKPRLTPNYLGILPVLLALAALVVRVGPQPILTRRRAWGVALGTLLCWVLAMGPNPKFAGVAMPPLYDLFTFVPGFSSMRAPSRFGLGVAFGIAALAGVGLSGLLARWGRSASVAAAVVTTAIVWSWVDFGHPFFRHKVMHPPVGAQVAAVYGALAELDEGAVLELPAGWQQGYRQLVRESEYTYASTFHWKPILNGYTGHQPSSTRDVMVLAQALPDAQATQLLSRLTGLRYVVVHLAGVPEERRDLWLDPPGLRMRGRYGDDLLFEVVEPREPDLQEALLARAPSDRTLLGNPVRDLEPESRVSTLEFAAQPPRALVTAFPRTIEVAVRNQTDVTWPALAPGSDGLVRWVVRWTNVESGAASDDRFLDPLPYDLLPGESLRTMISPKAPRQKGVYELRVGLSQNGRWFERPLTAGPITVGTMAGLMHLQKSGR